MNKIERIKAALAGKAVDHVPASFWFHFPGENRARKPMADAHLKYYEACDPDWLKVMNDTRYESPTGYIKGTAEFDLSKLEKPIPLSSECYESFLEGLRIIIERMQNEAPVIVTMFSPFATLYYMTLRDADRVIREQPEACEAALHGITASLIDFSRACIDAGAWGMYYSAQAGERGRLTKQEHSRFVEKFDRQLLSTISDAPFNLLHVCGKNIDMTPYWTYPVSCINWATGSAWENPTISEGRKETRMTIAAGLDHCGPIASGCLDALKAEVKTSLDESGRENFMLAAGCTISDGLDWNMIKAARDTCIELTLQ